MCCRAQTQLAVQSVQDFHDITFITPNLSSQAKDLNTKGLRAFGLQMNPTRHGVVVDVENMAYFKLLADKLNNEGAVHIRYPAPNSMKTNVIKLR